MVSRRALLALFAGAGLLPAMPAAAETWRTYRNPRFGTAIDYPERFRPGRPPDNGAGLTFTAADAASFSIWGSHNALDHDLKGLEDFIREDRPQGEQLTYVARGSNWFVLSGTRGDTTFYERHLLSHRGMIVNGFVILHPTALRGSYDPIVTRMSTSFRAGRGVDTEGGP
jgi:hypothetical protein